MTTLKQFKEGAENCGFRFTDPKDLDDIILERIDTWDNGEEADEWFGDDDTDSTSFGLDDAAWKEEKLIDLYNEIAFFFV